MPVVVAVKVTPEFAVLVPAGDVCQYQVSPEGAEPTAVNVTPGLEH